MQNQAALPALTGLRFVAAMAVFVHHVAGKFGFSANPYSIGALAVSFFFVFSGFILKWVYHDRLHNWSDVRKFWFTRFARIWPLHLLCLLVSISTMFSWSAFGAPTIWWKLGLNAALLQSWVPQTDWALSFNVVSWSISVEAFFYLMFPLLLLPRGPSLQNRMLLLLLVVGAAIAVVNHVLSPQPRFDSIDFYRMGHVNPLFRLPEFCCGIFVGRLFLAQANSAAGVGTSRRTTLVETLLEIGCFALIAVLAWLFWQFRISSRVADWSAGSEFLGSWLRVSWLAPLFAITILVFANSRGWVSRFLASRPLVYLGDISYAFYMIHFLVIRQVFHASLSYGPLPGWLIAGCCLAISIGCSMLLHRLIEIPSKRALLALHETGGRSARDLRINTLPVNGATRRIIMVGVLLLAFPIGMLAMHARQPTSSAEIQRIVASSPAVLRNVEFGNHIRLLGCQSVRVDNRIELNLAWVKRVALTRDRLVLVLDQDGKRIGRGSDSNDSFDAVSPGVPFVERVRLPISRLQHADGVVVMFRGRSQKNLLVDPGPRTRRKRELILLTKPEILQLLD